ncbi:MAG TPA: SUMF1/EgtB/PvdO family nonheme iron enzyme [Baekduia sp.]|nr:SUMF1/EgtB/PvdO family nonheme iron enzyme [Baekduia sp.]
MEHCLLGMYMTTDIGQAFADTREHTFDLIEGLSDDQLEAQIDPIMSPLVWDLGHIAAYEDLWLNNRYGGRPLLYDELTAVYDAFETPRAIRGEIEILNADQARGYMADVRARTLETIDELGPDPVLHELVLQHELQHTETMRQAMVMGGLLKEQIRDAGTDDDWVAIPAGAFTLGAPADRFSYDNERPPQQLELGAFEIARHPVLNGAWLEFCEDGGYARRELWSDAGWAWLRENQIDCPSTVRDSSPAAPVCHVSWFEAEAFARFRDARLPTEPEWERAYDELHDTGLVWEWTSSIFGPYPGFVADPYPEYSEVFFDRGYRCLRGGSWATHPRVGTPTFRNWDLPERRQIFAGLRLVREGRS